MARGGARPNTGGPRPGAGRKPGVPNYKNARTVAGAEAGGIMPTSVLLTEMRFHCARYEELLAEKRRDPDWRAECSDVLRAASIAAEKAAPYLHARLTTHKVLDESKLPADIDIRTLSDEQLYALIDRLREVIEVEKKKIAEFADE